MLISHQHRFLFIHVPKTAGLSIAAALDDYCHHAELYAINRGLSMLGINVNHFGPVAWRRGRVHAPARQVRQLFGNGLFDDYFKFAFVRNPWDRMVSYYHYVMTRTAHHRHAKVRNLGGFKPYLKYEAQRKRIGQSKLITDAGGDTMVDFVGRFENLADDFQEVCQRIGISAAMPHRNASIHRDYRTYYDDEAAEMVATHWREDVERFGYTFDDAVRTEPVETVRMVG